MATIKVGVVEDDLIIADCIVMLLTDLGYATTGPAGSYTRGLEMVKEERPDILLLDIQLSGEKDGIDLAAKLKEDYCIPFIFLTSNSDAATVARAKKLFPPAYLLKPVTKEKLYTSIEICLNNFSESLPGAVPVLKEEAPVRDFVFIKQGHHFHKIRMNDILYLESDNIYIHIYTPHSKLLVRSTLQHYLESIKASQFFRVHRSFAVNTDHIETINTESLTIRGIEIPIGKMYRDELLRFFRLG